MILTVGIKQKIFLDRSPPIFFTVVCLCTTKTRHKYLKFCAFAKKNAVSLTNQGCKGCQNEALHLYTALEKVPKRSSAPVHGTGKSSVLMKKLCAQEKTLCSVKSSVLSKKLRAQ